MSEPRRIDAADCAVVGYVLRIAPQLTTLHLIFHQLPRVAQSRLPLAGARILDDVDEPVRFAAGEFLVAAGLLDLLADRL